MKISTLVILSAVEAGRPADFVLDPAFNRNRPIRHPQSPADLPGLETLFPDFVRHDPALFNMVNKKLFTNSKGQRGFSPVNNKHRAIADDFFCTQDSMFLIHQTSNYTAFNTVNHTDFSFADSTCNHASGNFAWFAVGADSALEWSGAETFTSNIAGTDSVVSANCADDDTCGGIEYIAAIFPLDGCGTTAEMGTNDAGDDVVIFKNKIKNGAYNSQQGGQDTHNGIALDAVVDFTVQCSYLATYESNSLEMEAEQSALADKINENAGDIFNVQVEFMNMIASAADAGTTTRGGFNPLTGSGGQVTSVTLTDGQGNTFASAAETGHSVQVGDTAYARIYLEKPNDLIKIQVNACRLKNVAGNQPQDADGNPTSPLEYEFITANCGDPFTSAKVISEPDGAEGQTLISFTMFEFVDSRLEAFAVQNNFLECDVSICLRDQPCPGACSNSN